MKINIWRRLKTLARNDGGFTLMESLLGAAILTVAITGALSMEMIGINDHKRSREHTSNVHGAILQGESIGQMVQYHHKLLSHDDANATAGDPDPHDHGDMPVAGFEHASYSVKGGWLVEGLKIVYLTNQSVAGQGKRLTFPVAIPNTRRVDDTNYQLQETWDQGSRY